MEIDKNNKTDQAWRRLHARFEKDNLLVTPQSHASRHVKLLLTWTTIAAAIMVGVAFMLIPISHDDIDNLVTQDNKEQSTLVKTLEDGSVVYLAQQSTLQYPLHFDAHKREVNLQGEAFFDIAKSPQQRFSINTDKVRVEVLGTAFDVRSKDNAHFSLSVQRGLVKVSLKDGRQSIYAKAGETVTLHNSDLLLSATPYTERFNRYTQNIRFKDEHLEDVLRVINSQSPNMQIETATPVLGRRKLTVEFSNNSPASVAELISWTFNLKCLHQGNKLILSE